MKYALATLCAVLVTASSFAQGTVAFSNKKGTVDAPVFIGTTGTGAKAEGAGYVAQLYAGADANSLAPIGAAVPFRTGAGAGYWNPAPDAGRTIPTVAPGGTATIKVVAWNTAAGATYEQALAAGQAGSSSVFTVVTGGAGSPPGLPTDLVGLTSFAISAGAVPEPSVLALGAIGALGLLIRRRK